MARDAARESVRPNDEMRRNDRFRGAAVAARRAVQKRLAVHWRSNGGKIHSGESNTAETLDEPPSSMYVTGENRESLIV